MGYGDTHVGILSDTEALKELSCLLEATTAAGKREAPGSFLSVLGGNSGA